MKTLIPMQAIREGKALVRDHELEQAIHAHPTLLDAASCGERCEADIAELANEFGYRPNYVRRSIGAILSD